MKRNISLVLAMVLALAVIPSQAFGYVPDISDNSVVVEIDMDTTASEISDADVIVVNFDSLYLIADNAKGIVDAGKLLYIAAPQVSAEEVSEMLSIPKEGTLLYNNYLLVAYSIYSINGTYVFACHYATYGEGAEDSVIEASATSLLGENSEIQLPAAGESNFNITRTLDEKHIADDEIISNDLSAAINVMQRAVERSEEIIHNAQSNSIISLYGLGTGPMPTATRVYNNILDVYDSNDNWLGYLSGTLYEYDIGSIMLNNAQQFAYNLVSRVEAYPVNTSLRQYKCRIHCNIVGHTMLESTSLPSGINISETISLQGSFSTNGVGGSLGYNTSWSYNPNSQLIARSSPEPRVVDWTATPVNPATNDSFDLTPGMTVATTGSTGQRGAFTDLYCNAFENGNVIRENTIGIGSWF